MSSVEDRQQQIRALKGQAARAAQQSWQAPDQLPTDPLAQIAYWLEHERLTNDQVVSAIDSARSAGAKWWEIGAAMGRTSEAARAFYQYHRRQSDDR